MKLVLGGIEVIEQPLRVQSAAGTGYGNKYSQGGWNVKSMRLPKYSGTELSITTVRYGVRRQAKREAAFPRFPCEFQS